MRREDPLTLHEVKPLLAPLGVARGIVVAVSGGPDSIALMNFLARAARDAALPPLTVATIDHGLQPGSADLARRVAQQAGQLGLEAHILPWQGSKPPTGIQAAARKARYDLLIGLAERRGASHLVTAHTLDDQAETILFRMARGSGPAGLSGMRSAVSRGAILHVRPFLDVSKQRLIAACEANGWAFVADPANRDLRFARARMRKLLPLLALEGLDAAALAALGRRLARSDAAISEKAEAALAQSRLRSEPGGKAYAAARLMAEPSAVLVRAIEIDLADFAHDGPPRLARLESLVDALEKAYRRGNAFRRTLHGAIVSWRCGDVLEIVREPPRRRPAGPPPTAASDRKG